MSTAAPALLRVMHLYANSKWTGPCELALLLAQHQDGLEVDGVEVETSFAVSQFVAPGLDNAVAKRAHALGVRTCNALRLRRHLHVPSLLADARQLTTWIDDGAVDVLHCHQPGDHLTAALAQRTASRQVRIVRSVWDGTLGHPGPRARLAFAETAAATAVFDDVAAAIVDELGFPAARVATVAVPGGAPAAARDVSLRDELFRELGLASDVFLVGITARIQRKRRWELLWNMLADAVGVHLAVLGRPDDGVFDEVCARPIAELGLQERVHFLGYRFGEAYHRVLGGLDAFVFLVPGSDATCRALREAMAVGLPVVATDLGRIPDLVTNDVDGLVRPADSAVLGRALDQLRVDEAGRDRLGRAAADTAVARWSAEVAAEQCARLYRSLEA